MLTDFLFLTNIKFGTCANILKLKQQFPSSASKNVCLSENSAEIPHEVGPKSVGGWKLSSLANT
jgi:hypothetical protein